MPKRVTDRQFRFLVSAGSPLSEKEKEEFIGERRKGEVTVVDKKKKKKKSNLSNSSNSGSPNIARMMG